MTTLSLAALALALAGLGLSTWLVKPASSVNRWFAIYTLAVAGWVVGVGGLQSGTSLEAWGRFTFASASLVPAAFVIFTHVYPAPGRWPTRGLRHAAVTAGAIFCVLSLTSPFVIHNVRMTPLGLTRSTGPLYGVFVLYFLAGWLGGLGIFIDKWRRARGQERAQLQYLGIGLVISAGGLISNLLVPALTGTSAHTWIGPYFLLPLPVLVAHATVRHRLMDIRVVIHRSLVFALVIVGLSVGVLATIWLIFPPWLAESVTLPLGAVVLSLIAALVLSAPGAYRIERLLATYLWRGRLDHSRALREAARSLAQVIELPMLAKEVRNILAATVVPETVTLLVQMPNGQSPEPLIADHLERGGPAADELLIAAWGFDGPVPGLRLLASAPGAGAPAGTAAVLKRAGVDVWLGLGRPDHRLAVLLLGRRKSGEAYLATDLDFLAALADLVSIVLEAACLHRHHLALMQERERDAHFARMGKLYAGLAHEIRNPLTLIKTMAELLPTRWADPEFRATMERHVPKEIDALVELSERIRAMTPTRQIDHRCNLSIRTPLTEVLGVQSVAAEAKRVRLAWEIPAALPPVLGNADQLCQLFRNLVQNAIEATPSGCQVTVTVTAEGQEIRVRVIDEGTGIDPSISDQLFDPFVTNKPKGMGLGLTICREIAKAHDARLTIQNRTDGPGVIAEVTFCASASTAARRLVNAGGG